MGKPPKNINKEVKSMRYIQIEKPENTSRHLQVRKLNLILSLFYQQFNLYIFFMNILAIIKFCIFLCTDTYMF